MEELNQVEQLLRKTRGLNQRQISLLSHAIRHPDARYTIASHRTSQQVVYETARQDLFVLEEKGLLESHKMGRTYVFFPTRRLEERMKRLH